MFYFQTETSDSQLTISADGIPFEYDPRSKDGNNSEVAKH